MTLEIKSEKELYFPGVTPKSTNNLFYWWADKKGRATRARKSKHYKNWRNEFIKLLPDDFMAPNSRDIHLYIEVQIFKEFDLDNTLKAIIDALQIKYKFNDNEIVYLVCKKFVVGTFHSMQPEEHYIRIRLLEKFQVSQAEETHFCDISTEQKLLLNENIINDVHDGGEDKNPRRITEKHLGLLV
jgi:Holliday junction resolvase RusA-like endonuclease